jgi:hypothetical protein
MLRLCLTSLQLLKEEKREGCEVDIDKLCQQHKECLLLWDGAFSAARTINPTDANCYMYKLFVMAAIDCHVNIGCSITHKVHLMLCHVLEQMSKIPGGLGEKMEDWVELMHQIGNRDSFPYNEGFGGTGIGKGAG